MWLFMSWLEERVDPSLHPQRGLYTGSTLSGPSLFLSDWPALRDTHRVQSVPAHNQDYLPAWKACKINHKIHGHDPFLTSTLGDRKTHMVALGQICSKLVQSHETFDNSCSILCNRKYLNKQINKYLHDFTKYSNLSCLKGNVHHEKVYFSHNSFNMLWAEVVKKN